MTNGHLEFQFSPRPAAHAMKWDDLMPPVRRAVHDLLVRIRGSEIAREELGKINKNKMEFGNCFLVYGTRGTGKSTVLLSAQDAVCRDSSFFEETDYGKARRKKSNKVLKQQENNLKNSAQNCGNALKGSLVWLDILDLEPLPTKANLLAALLTRVSNALGSSTCDKTETALTSIFEEGTDSARQQLGRLINDATLMWENINEQDTRSIANRQVAAAGIYAKFRSSFKDAMDKLSQELGRSRGFSDKGCSILLPIDNIDRSTDHLQSIVKLAQLVSHCRLWLVMAGDRVEVDTFLERAYWKELIHSQGGADAKGKTGLRGEDEALVMARRQASATAQNLWPTIHRIEVHMMMPEETLKFSPPDQNTDEAIYELLKSVAVPISKEQRKGQSNSGIHLIDLFDLNTSFLVDTENPPAEKGKPVLTHAAKHGLTLPARTVLDLWQLNHWVINDHTSFISYDFRAEKIVRTMLRNAISSSTMSSAIGYHLQEDILRRSEDGGTLLWFDEAGPKLSLTEMTMRVCNVQLCVDHQAGYDARSTLTIQKVEDLIFNLRREHPSKSYLNSYKGNPDKYPQPFIIATEGEEQKMELPPHVAAWLSILHDILALAEPQIGSAVINAAPDFSPGIIEIKHEVIGKSWSSEAGEPGPLNWPTPAFGTGLAYDLFKQRWQCFQKDLKAHTEDRLGPEDLLLRLLATSWVIRVLETFKILTANPKYRTDDCIMELLSSEKQIMELCFKTGSENTEKEPPIEAFEKKAMKAAATLYANIKNDMGLAALSKSNRRLTDRWELNQPMIDWLENELPYLLSYLYVPVKVKSSKNRCEELVEHIEKLGLIPNLAQHWKDNSAFILSKFEEKLPKRYPKKITPSSGGSKGQSSSEEDPLKCLLDGPFGDLHRLWSARTKRDNPYAFL